MALDRSRSLAAKNCFYLGGQRGLECRIQAAGMVCNKKHGMGGLGSSTTELPTVLRRALTHTPRWVGLQGPRGVEGG